MRAFLGAAALATLLAFTSLPASAETTTGTVQSIDMNAMTLTLDDGTVYTLPEGFENADIKAGSKVVIDWDIKDGKNVANEVKLAE